MLAKTAGVKHLVILINKMDDPTVEWEKSRYYGKYLFECIEILPMLILRRYDECKEKLVPFLKKVGFNPKTGLLTLF